MYTNSLYVRDLEVETGVSLPLGSAVVTVADAFTLAINALMGERGWNQSDVMRKTGLSSPMVSRMASPKPKSKRGASFPTLELLRTAFDVTAADLFIPRVVDVTGRVIDTKLGDSAHELALAKGDPVGSGANPSLQGGPPDVSAYPDPELLSAVLSYWCAMSPEARLEVLATSHRLKGPGAPPATAVGFMRR